MAQFLGPGLVGLGQGVVSDGDRRVQELEPERSLVPEFRGAVKAHRIPAAALNGGDQLADCHVVGPAHDVDPGLTVHNPGAGPQDQDDGPVPSVHVDADKVRDDRRRHPGQVVGSPQGGREPAVAPRPPLLVGLQAGA